MPAEFDAAEMLRVLEEHDVRFVIVGGFAAWIHGAPVVTTDLDIVYENSPENVERLLNALNDLDAIYRAQLGRVIRPTAGALISTAGGGHHLFETKSGNLDALREVAGYTWVDLEEDSVRLEIESTSPRFATLRRVIELKETAGRPKDLAALPMLRAVLEDDE